MVVATTASNGDPSARVVLCKRVDVAAGYVVFFTNYESRKGRELAARPRAAAVLPLGRTASASANRRPGRALARQRERPVFREPRARQPDRRMGQRAKRAARFARSHCSNACASSPHASASQPGATNGTVPRPPHWGGHRLWIDTIELWTEGANRVHDRAVWTRSLQRADEYSFAGGPWRSTRLNP